MIAGDNGEAFYENGHPTHAGPPFESAIRVGLVMYCPAVLTPATETYLVQLIDVAPTALALLGIAPHPCFQGIDVLAADRPPNDKRLVFVHCESALSGSDAVISGTGWKYVEDRRSGQSRLHQLSSDPGEQENVAAHYPEVRAVLDGVLREWRQRQLLYYQTPVRRFVRVCVLGAGLLVLVGYVPWLPNVWRQSENLRTSWARPLSVSALVQQPFAGLAGIPDNAPVEPEALAWTVTFVLLAVLLVSGMGGGPGGVFLFLVGTIPLLLNVAYSTVSVRSIFVARYFAFVQPAWLASFALAVSRIPRYPERAMVAAVLVLWSGFGWSEYWDALGPGHKPGMRAAAAYVSEGHAPGEMVLAQTPWVYFKLAYYLPAHIPVRLCVDVVDRQGHFGSTHLQPSDMITLDDAIAERPARLWIVTSRCYNYTGYLYPDIALPST